MNPWSLGRGSHAAPEASTPQAHATSQNVPRQPRGYQLDHGDDSSSSDSELHPPRPGKGTARFRHTRSVSHPAPSFFSIINRNRSDSTGERPPNSDPDSSDDLPPGTNGRRGPSMGTSRRGGHHRHPSRDFTAGNCMACGSHMRWPRELMTYRCTICLTINDLAPMPTGDTGGGPGGRVRESPPDAGPAGGQMPLALVKPISNSHTAHLVRQCLRSFFSTSLGCGASQAPDPSQSVASGEAGAGLARGEFTGIPMVLEPNAHVSSSPPTMEPTPAQMAWESKPSKRRFFPRGNMNSRSYSSSSIQRPRMKSVGDSDEQSSRPQPSSTEEKAKRIFKPLEDYIISSFSSFECINSSFSTTRDHSRIRSESASGRHRVAHRRRDSAPTPVDPLLSELDPKLLMVGNFAENGSWWIGSQDGHSPPRGSGQRQSGTRSHVSHRSLRMDGESLRAWYNMVIHPAQGWREICEEITSEYSLDMPPPEKLKAFERQLLAGQDHARKVLGREIEGLLRRPGRPITDPDNLRFLLVALDNPLLRPGNQPPQAWQPRPEPSRRAQRGGRQAPLPEPHSAPGPHSELIKRILGLISQSSTPCHDHLIIWLSRLPRDHLKEINDLVSGFITCRLARQNSTQPEPEIDITGGLIPDLGDGRSASALQAVLEASSPANAQRKAREKIKMIYSDDWQVRAASRVMALIFAANNLPASPRRDASTGARQTSGKPEFSVQHTDVRARGQILPTSDFYVPLIDSADLNADFEAWEAKRGAFAFCQYPFLLSISAKTEVLEYEARRQMLSKARDAFFDSILNRKSVNQYWVLDVRRDCLVEDSLKGVSEVIGSGSEDIKKGLRIAFSSEEGIDHGGLRKEWFLLLVREVFNPDNGMFTYEEDSNYCYFNPHCFETSDQFFLVGVVMGLAIYNSTILDIPLPPFAFRKLLATGPSPPLGSAAHPKPTFDYSLDDLAEIRPRLASGLRQLLDYDGNVEETFALNFTIGTDKYGTLVQVPLLSGGADQAVTNDNRRKYVDLYVRYSLDVAVKRQFEPFKRGFYTVCGGNALTLFRPEEIELLVRGSDEELDIAALRRVAVYENWGTDSPDDGSVSTVRWLWEIFETAAPRDQRRLLLFVTGSDRIPATGPSSLQIKISCMGGDSERFPTARTCFNMLVLWRYSTREKLRKKLWMAAYESEGFGLK